MDVFFFVFDGDNKGKAVFHLKYFSIICLNKVKFR